MTFTYWDFSGGVSGKEPTYQRRKHKRREAEPWARKIPLEERTATQSSILVWGTPWTEEPGGLLSTELQNQTRLSALALTHPCDE